VEFRNKKTKDAMGSGDDRISIKLTECELVGLVCLSDCENEF